MAADPQAGVTVAATHGSHLLVRSAAGFAIVERRAGRIHPLVDGDRPGWPDDAAGMLAAVGDGWADEATVRRRFAALTARGDRLAERLL